MKTLREGARQDPEVRAVDLFAGCGGMTVGLKSAGFRVVAAVEIDSDAAASYRANHKDVNLLRRDIRRISGRELLRTIGARRGQLDLLAGCPPCQGFTRLTEQSSRKDPRNLLINDFLRMAKALHPRVCMMENVPGLMSRGRPLFDKLVNGLERQGYVVHHKIVQLADYGVPQLRKRLVVLASRGEPLDIPAPTHCKPAQTTKKVAGRRVWRTVRDAIQDLPFPPTRSSVISGNELPKYPWHYARDTSEKVLKRLKFATKHKQGRVKFPRALRLECHRKNPNGYFDVYGSMRWDAPSSTITSGCTNASKGRFGHPSFPRPITATEAALLQTFPISYRFVGGLESVARQIGNALPARFASVMGRSIVRSLNKAA